MISHCFMRLVLFTVVAASVFVVGRVTVLRAQGMGYMGQSLTEDQQSAANSALCSAVGSQVPNPASASPSLLSSRSIISAAASIFAGSTHLPLPDATTMLQGYVAQHGSDILASCAVSNATSGVTSKIPGARNLPSVPNVP